MAIYSGHRCSSGGRLGHASNRHISARRLSGHRRLIKNPGIKVSIQVMLLVVTGNALVAIGHPDYNFYGLLVLLTSGSWLLVSVLSGMFHWSAY